MPVPGKLHRHRIAYWQAVARIADRTALQHLWGPRDVIGHVTIWYPILVVHIGPYPIYWWSLGTKPLSVTVSDIFNVECNAMVDMTLTLPLTKVKVIHFGTNRFLIYDFI